MTEPVLPPVFSDEQIEAARVLFAHDVSFMMGAVQIAGLPPADLPEVAFAGRSNVGKSSLINAVAGRLHLARASNEPGRTREVNFFVADGKLRLVDLPGYGFARAGRKDVKKFQNLGRDYLRGRPNLKRAYLLIDARHGLKSVDTEALDAFDLAAVERCAAPVGSVSGHRRRSRSLDEMLARRMTHLAAYQDEALAQRYHAMIERIRAAEHRVAPHYEDLTEAAARSLSKLMSYKDEYEVARLYSDGEFMASLKEQFEDWERLEIHLAPPALGQAKRRFGPWMLKLMPLLARMKVLRGTLYDPFGYGAERKRERALITEFEHVLETVIDHLGPSNHAVAVEIATLPRHIRGFGPVKDKAVADYHARLAEMTRRFGLD